MNIEQVQAAAAVVAWLAEQTRALGEHSKEQMEMMGSLEVTRLYLLEYTAHLVSGGEPYDALLSTARGELRFTQKQKDVFRAVTPPREV